MRRFNKRLPSYLLFCVLIVFSGLLLQSRCTFKSPSKPVWEVQLEIPLINRTYTMEDIIEDSDELTVDSATQEILFSFEEKIDTALVGDYLAITGISIENIYPLGSIRDSTATPDSLVLVRGEIEKGSVTVKVRNDNNFSVHVHFELPDLKKGGIVFTLDLDLNPYGSYTDTRELEGYTFEPPLVGDRNYVRFYAEATGNGNPGSIRIELSVQDVSFYSIRGWLKDVDVSIDEVEQEVEIPKIIGGLEVASAEMAMTIFNGIQAPGSLNIHIEGTNDEGGSDSLQISDEIVPAPGPDEVGETPITEDVASFINILPTHIRYSGTVKVGRGYIPGTNPVEIRQDDFVTGIVDFQVPLIIKIRPDTSESKVDTVSIGEGTRDTVSDNLKELSIVAEIENHTPLGAEVSLIFSKTVGDSMLYQESRNKLLTIGPLALAPAELVLSEDNTTWVVGRSGTSQFEQKLVENRDISYFEEEEIYLGVRIVFSGTQGKQVKIQPSDYIGLKAYGSLKVLTKIPEEDDEGGGK